MSGFPPVVRAAWVNRPIDEAFHVFTSEIGAWWPLPSHGTVRRRLGERCIQRWSTC